MVERLALCNQVHEPPVGDSRATLHLQAPQIGAPPSHYRQASVGQPGAAAQPERLHGVAQARGVARQQANDGLEREVGVDGGAGAL